MMFERYRNGGMERPTSVVDWTNGRILAAGFTTPEDADAAASLASLAFREGVLTAQREARRALGLDADD